MSDNQEYDLWLEKAEDDLHWTKANIREKIYYGACFTAQQAVEKALKAYLIFKKGKFDKVHDLVKLLETCSEFDKEFTRYKKEIAKLTFYYVQARYPDIGDIDVFTKIDADEALETAETIITIVTEKLITQIQK